MMWGFPGGSAIKNLPASAGDAGSTLSQGFGGCVCVCALSCPTLCDPMDDSPAGSFYMGFPRQEYWSRLPFPTPGAFQSRD